jgi:hypothetical protein
VTGLWTAGAPRAPAVVLAAAGAVLSAAVQTDATDDAGGGIRDELRAVLVRQLDADLVTEDVLLGAFRGRLPDG